MKQDEQKTNWFIDAVLFGGFIVAFWLDLTGVAVHQVLGAAVAVLAGYHLWKHWRWVEAVSERFFGRTSIRSRTYYVVDAALAAGLAAIALTGLVISTWLSLALAGYEAWRVTHVVASVVTLAVLVVKIGLHWRWVVDVARRRVFGTTTTAKGAQAQAAQGVSVTRLGRRDFVRLMAGVGAVALLAGTNALASTLHGGAEASSSEQVSGTGLTQVSTSASNTSSSCVVRCGRGCSYPGHCRKYTDSNDNGRCDLGECMG